MTQDQVDTWLNKGIGGAVDMIENRSRMNKFVGRSLYEEISEALKILEASSVQTKAHKESPDQAVCVAMNVLASLMFMRVRRMGIRSPNKEIQKSITMQVQRLRESLARLEIQG